MQIRQITAAERTATMFPLQAYAFMPSPWQPGEEDAYRRRSRFHETAVTLVAEEQGEVLAGVAALRMRQNVRGRIHDMAGVASVASHPSARRRGLVRALLRQLLRQLREEGCAVSALYPFRPSFYGRFGYVGIPRRRTATFAPAGLSDLLRTDLPGEVERMPITEGFAAYDGLMGRLLLERHGFAVFDEVRSAEVRDEASWLAVARAGDEVVGAARYRVDRYGGDLVAADLLTVGALGRALLLQFFARHVDQVARIVVPVETDDVPELWGTDLEITTEAKVAYPRQGGPMVRVLDMPALSGTTVGPGDVTIRIADDELVGGAWRLSGDGGLLTVAPGNSPRATLTAAGFSALFYGVLDPVEVRIRGLGEIADDTIDALGSLFPRRMPQLCVDF